jgi:hypothetical protein
VRRWRVDKGFTARCQAGQSRLWENNEVFSAKALRGSHCVALALRRALG